MFPNIIAAIIACMEILVLTFEKIHEAKVGRDIFGKSQKEVLREIKPSSQNELERAREELRTGIRIMMVSTVLALVVLYFTEKLAWNLALAVGLALVIYYNICGLP